MQNHDFTPHPTQQQVEEAVKLILRWAGDNPEREGLLETPARFAKAIKEYCKGYHMDPYAVLAKNFSEIAGYNDMVTISNIDFSSHCEHHLAPFTGKAHVAYLPNGKVVGISKIARLVEIFSLRLQIQEKLTSQIANTIHECLRPQGVFVMIEAKHYCMNCRGIKNRNAIVKTQMSTGIFTQNTNLLNHAMKLFVI